MVRREEAGTELRLSQRPTKQFGPIREPEKKASTHVGGLLVVVDVVDVSGQAKVSYFHHVVLGHQDIAGGQISVDALSQ